MRVFTNDPNVIAQGSLYLRIISLNFVATGIITAAAIFQALGNTWPALISTGSRLFTFILPAWWISTWPHYRIEETLALSVATVALQAVTSLLFVRREFRLRLPRGGEEVSATPMRPATNI